MNLVSRANSFATRHWPSKRAKPASPTAVASITFDDFPRNAWTIGGQILARYDAKATYYVAGSFCGRTQDGLDYYDEADLRALVAAGHEIGCHSFSHQMSPTLSSQALIAEAERNLAFLNAALGPFNPASYAYPYGEASPRTKRLLGDRFATVRGIRGGVNAGTLDLGMLKSIPLEARRWVPDEIDAAIDAAVAQAGWVTFFTHDVSDAPSPFGCTPAMLEHVLQRLQAAGIPVLTIKDAAARIGLPAQAAA